MNILAQRVSEGRSSLRRMCGVRRIKVSPVDCTTSTTESARGNIRPGSGTRDHVEDSLLGIPGGVKAQNIAHRSSTWRPLCHFCQKISGVFLTTKMDGTVQRNGNRRQLWVLI